ncbi:c-type cytochrome, partial [Achromobacter ruhlandii]
MSNEQEHIEEHSSPIKTPKQLIVTVILAFVVPIAIIILLVNMVASGAKVGAGSDTLSTEAVTKRIAPVAGFELVDANAPKVFKTGEQVFQAVCTACHTAGVAGAPKVGDNAAWAPFIKSGFDAMMNVALHGKGGMPAKGGNPTLSDFEVARAVVYMANKSGGSLPEPAAPAEEGAKKEADAAPAAPAAAAPAAAPAAAAPAAAAPAA